MNGDLSLSQSLGGLRIANPDNDDAISLPSSSPQPIPVTPVGPSSRPSMPSLNTPSHPPQPLAIEPSSFNEPPQFGSEGVNIDALGFNPTSYATDSQSYPNSNQISTPGNYHPPQRLHQPHSIGALREAQNQSAYPSAYPNRLYNPASVRPASGIFSPTSIPQGPSSVAESPYQRVRAESAQSAASGTSDLWRHEGTRTAPTDIPSARATNGRAGRQTSASNPSSNSAFPPRRSSKTAGGNESAYGPSASQSSRSQLSPTESTIPQTTEELKERAATVAPRKPVESESNRQPSKSAKKGVKDFSFGRTLGEGSYSTVLAATDRTTSKEYAIKVLDKRHIIKEKKVKYVNIEKDTLNRLTEHPGIVRLYYTFQDDRSLYFVLDLATGGELLGVLKKWSTFDEECSRFYGAQILDAIEYMHIRGIIHRDLKPENVLLDDQMHVKITDFGTAKILDLSGNTQFGQVSVTNDPLDGADTDRAVSFVGTAEYVSPELLTDKNACKASDLWAFGCIIYQLLAGRPPFKASNEYQTFQKIVHLDYTFPDGFPAVARDLVTKLLVLNPADRLHVNDIKSHPFFNGIQWGKGLWKQKAPKLKPFHPSKAPDTKSREQPKEPQSTPSQPTNVKTSQSTPAQQSSTTPPRPQPRIITELAPPSQLDIDWSPVLTKANERIIKLGQLVVYSTPAPHSPTSKSGSNGETQTPVEVPSKFSRFFGASVTKKRQRLVMITSGARLVLAPSGGDKKEAKQIVNLTDSDVSWKSQQDSKGYTVWCVLTRERHLTFEDPKANTGDPGSSMRSTKEWMDIIEEVKSYGFSRRTTDPFPEDSMNGLGPSLSNPGPSNEAEETNRSDSAPGATHRRVLRRDQAPDEESSRGLKRFSKRHSKNGFAAVF